MTVKHKYIHRLQKAKSYLIEMNEVQAFENLLEEVVDHILKDINLYT